MGMTDIETVAPQLVIDGETLPLHPRSRYSSTPSPLAPLRIEWGSEKPWDDYQSSTLTVRLKAPRPGWRGPDQLVGRPIHLIVPDYTGPYWVGVITSAAISDTTPAYYDLQASDLSYLLRLDERTPTDLRTSGVPESGSLRYLADDYGVSILDGGVKPYTLAHGDEADLNGAKGYGAYAAANLGNLMDAFNGWHVLSQMTFSSDGVQCELWSRPYITNGRNLRSFIQGVSALNVTISATSGALTASCSYLNARDIRVSSGLTVPDQYRGVQFKSWKKDSKGEWKQDRVATLPLPSRRDSRMLPVLTIDAKDPYGPGVKISTGGIINPTVGTKNLQAEIKEAMTRPRLPSMSITKQAGGPKYGSHGYPIDYKPPETFHPWPTTLLVFGSRYEHDTPETHGPWTTINGVLTLDIDPLTRVPVWTHKFNVWPLVDENADKTPTVRELKDSKAGGREYLESPWAYTPIGALRYVNQFA